MHVPPSFHESDPEALHSLIRQYPLGTLVASVDQEVKVVHTPFHLVTTASGATLRSHIARANPLWQQCGDGQRVLVIFHGPNGYISPNDYPTKRDHGRVVPTWNYAVVHAHGTLRVVHDRDWLYELLHSITDSHERATQVKPWSVGDAPAAYTERLAKAIVGLDIDVQELVGNFKLSQNKSAADRDGVLNGLASREAEPLIQQMRSRRSRG